MEMWHCKRCGRPQPAKIINGKYKVARFMTGFVGIQLVCSHWAAVRLDKVN